MQSQMSQISIDDCTHGQVVRLKDMTNSHPMSNTERVVQDLHDILYSYYKVARKRFVDSVCMQAADHFLINGPDTPLALFSPKFVSTAVFAWTSWKALLARIRPREGVGSILAERLLGKDNLEMMCIKRVCCGWFILKSKAPPNERVRRGLCV